MKPKLSNPRIYKLLHSLHGMCLIKKEKAKYYLYHKAKKIVYI